MVMIRSKTQQSTAQTLDMRLVLGLLPLVLSMTWPRSYGPSFHISPFLMGLAAIAWAGLWVHPKLHVRTAWWLLLCLLVFWASPWTQTLQMWATVAAAGAAWIAVGIGGASVERPILARVLLGALIIAALINTFVAWLQFFDAEMSLYPLVSVNGGLRPYGNLRQPNHFATLCAIALVSVWWGFQQGFWQRRTSICLVVVVLSGLALSDSRAGWVELVVVSIFMACWSDGDKRFNRWLFGLAPVWTLLWALCIQGLAQSFDFSVTGFTDRGTASVSARFEHWRAAWELATRHPTLGVGWGEFRYTRFMELPVVTGAEVADNAHNVVLHLLAEIGFAGTFLVLAPVVWVLATVQPWRQSASTGQRWGWLTIMAVGVHALLEYPLWYMNFLLPLAMAFGAVMNKVDKVERAPPPSDRSVMARAAPILSAALLFMTSLAAYDFSRVAPAFHDDNRATGDPKTSAEAQRTWIFGVYADRILVEHVQVTRDNAQQMWDLSLRSMRAAHAPLNLWSGLAARCQMGGGVQATELARRFGLAFPDAYAEFRRLTPDQMFNACVSQDVIDSATNVEK